MLGILDPVVQSSENSLSNCFGINHLQMFLISFQRITCGSLVSLDQRRNFLFNIRIHMQHGKSLFPSCFHSRDDNTNPYLGLLTDCGPILCVGCVLPPVEGPNNRLSDSLGTEDRQFGCSFAIHRRCKLPPSVHQFAVFHEATRHIFLLTQSTFSPICCNLPSIQAPFLFLFPPLPVHWVVFPLSMQAGAAYSGCGERCFGQHRVSGAQENR